MQVIMTECDNPNCPEVAAPENEKPYVPPYGWLRLSGDFVGCGPAIKIEVCSPACLTPAVEAAR